MRFKGAGSPSNLLSLLKVREIVIIFIYTCNGKGFFNNFSFFENLIK